MCFYPLFEWVYSSIKCPIRYIYTISRSVQSPTNLTPMEVMRNIDITSPSPLMWRRSRPSFLSAFLPRTRVAKKISQITWHPPPPPAPTIPKLKWPQNTTVRSCLETHYNITPILGEFPWKQLLSLTSQRYYRVKKDYVKYGSFNLQLRGLRV